MVRPEFLSLFVAYLVLLVLVGLGFSRRMRSLEDFFLASRALPSSLVFLSLVASWFGATSILVTADEAFRSGLSAIWLVGVPAVVTVLIFGIFLARPIRRLDILTLPDLFERRYGKAVRHLASFLILWYMIVLAASQMVALGQFLQPFLGLPYVWSLVLGTGVVLVYLLSGGLLSVAATDILQCFFLTFGTAGLAVFLARKSPVSVVVEAAEEAGRRGYLDILSDLGRNGLIAFSFILAWTISPIAWQRIQAARSEQAARRAFFGAAGAFVPLYGLVVAIGVFSFPLFSGRKFSGPLLSETIASTLGTWGGALMFVAVAAAILSTMDTAINTGALTLTQDIYFQVIRGAGKRRGAVRAGRTSTLLVAALALAVASRFQSILMTLGVASEIMAEGLFVPGMAMLFFKKRWPLAGGLSLLLGGGFALLSFLSAVAALPFRFPVWPFSVPYGVAFSLVGFGIGAAIEKIRPQARGSLT